MPVELYNKSGFGRRIRKVLIGAVSGMAKLHSNFYSSRESDGVLTFVGPNIANITGTNAVAITPVATAAAFAGKGTRTYAKVGSWPGWATLNTSTGAITGTAATGTSTNLRVGVSAPGYGSAQSNLFSITI